MTIDEDGPICRCGNRGCLDTFVGAQAVLGALRGSHGALTLRDVITRALDGDPGCRRVLEDSGRHIGVAVAGVVNLLNPEVVCLGGQVARVGEIILQPMREAIERCAIPSAAASVVVADQRAGPGGRRRARCSGARGPGAGGCRPSRPDGRAEQP